MNEIKRYYPSDMQLNLGQPRIVFTEHSNGQLCMYEDVAIIIQRNKELEEELERLREQEPEYYVSTEEERDIALNTLAEMFESAEEAEGEDGMLMSVDISFWNEGCEALEVLIGGEDGVDPTIQRNKELEAEITRLRERKKISVGAMVNAFLGWKLPTDFSPDAGISFDCEYEKKWGMPTGTNLLNAGQARQMVEHILCGCEPKPAQEIPAELVGWANSWQEDDSDMPSYLVGCNDMKHFVKSQLEKMKGGA